MTTVPRGAQPLSPAVQLMTVELLSQVLVSTSPLELGEALATQVRELTGARTVMILVHCATEDGDRLLSVSPPRRSTLFTTEQLARFCPHRTPGELPPEAARLPDDHPLRAMLLAAGIDVWRRYPLHAVGELVGQLLLFELPEPERLDEIDRTLLLLSPMIALALKNALSFRQLEEQAQELERRVAERTAELQFTRFCVERASDAIFWIDASGRIVDVNDAACSSLGYSREEMLALSIPDIDIHFDAARFPEQFLRVRQQGSHTFESELRTRDGRVIPVEVVANYVEFGGRDYNCAFVRNIRERKEQHERLVQALSAAEAASRAKSEFLANMSHEIRTPMNGVLGMAELLRFTPLNADQREYLDSIETSGNNLLSLISDILDLSKIEAGRMELESLEFSLPRAIREVVTSQTARLREKQLPISIALEDDLPELLRGDLLRCKQVLLNLLGNAIKFTEAGGITLGAQVVSRNPQQVVVRFEIRDTGIGMSPEVLGRIFSPFVQADSSSTRKYGGSGLGLAICKRLVELMGGRIWAQSQVGQGSCFFVEIPFAAAESQQVKAARAVADLRQVSGGRPLKVLVVEDDAMNAFIFKEMLQKMGHSVAIAEHGGQGLERWRQEHWDCILMDIHMPEMDGCLATAAIRRQEREQGGHVPIIAVTAKAMSGDREKLLSQGFDSYLGKPVSMRLLAEELGRLTTAGLAE